MNELDDIADRIANTSPGFWMVEEVEVTGPIGPLFVSSRIVGIADLNPHTPLVGAWTSYLVEGRRTLPLMLDTIRRGTESPDLTRLRLLRPKYPRRALFTFENSTLKLPQVPIELHSKMHDFDRFFGTVEREADREFVMNAANDFDELERYFEPEIKLKLSPHAQYVLAHTDVDVNKLIGDSL